MLARAVGPDLGLSCGCVVCKGDGRVSARVSASPSSSYAMSNPQTASKDKKIEEKKDDKADSTKKIEEKPVPPTPTAEIKSNIALIERAVADLEPRFTHRVLRSLTALRKRLGNKILRDAIEENYPLGVYAFVDTIMTLA